MLVVNEAGEIELSNPCAEKLFGYEKGELVGKLIETLIPEDLRRQHISHRKDYFDKPKTRPMGIGMELYARKKDGNVFPVEISLGHYELEGEKLAVAFVTDITAQVKAKKMMEERETWFRNMAENSPVMIWTADSGRSCTYFNNTWLEFTGRSMDQQLGLSWLGDIHPEDKQKCISIYHEAYDVKKPYSLEYRLRRRDGQYRWIQESGKPTYTSDDQFTGYIGSCSDIHDQRIAKEELETLIRKRTTELHQALVRERAMSEMKSKFVSMASHEFRTPLSVILSSVSLIDQYGGDNKDERINKHLVRIRSSISNLTAILNDFLSLDKLEQGNVIIEQETFNITTFTNELLEGMRLLLKRGQNIKVDHKGYEMVTLDQNKLRHILENLISNAIKYSGENMDIFLNLENSDGVLAIVLKDHGIGIPQEEQKSIFSKFFRAKNALNIQGTGLGLIIVKRYVELMNGNINFKSVPGEGTSFTINLPNFQYYEDNTSHRG